MTQYSRIAAFLSIAFLVGCVSAWSQDATSLPVHDVITGEHIVLVTTASPQKRQDCRVKSLSADELVCSGAFGHTRSFQKEDVAALIRNRKLNDVTGGAIVGGSILTAIGGAIFYGAICVAMIAAPYIALAIPIALAGGVIGAGSLSLTVSMAAETTTDLVLYQKPGQTLQVELRN